MSRTKPTHIEVYLFSRRPKLALLMLRRSLRDSLPGIWQPVTGRIHSRERALDAATREVREETGLEPKRWWRLEHVVTYLHPPSDELRVVPLFAAEITDRSGVRLSDEHDAFRWATVAAAGSLVLWDTQRAALQAFRSQVLGAARVASALEIHDSQLLRRAPDARATGRTRGASSKRRARG